VVQEAGDTGFDLVLDDGSTERIGYGDVVQARTVFEWGPQPKRSKSQKTRSPKASPGKASFRKTTSPRESVRP
jgi:hypothetical protein